MVTMLTSITWMEAMSRLIWLDSECLKDVHVDEESKTWTRNICRIFIRVAPPLQTSTKLCAVQVLILEDEVTVALLIQSYALLSWEVPFLWGSSSCCAAFEGLPYKNVFRYGLYSTQVLGWLFSAYSCLSCFLLTCWQCFEGGVSYLHTSLYSGRVVPSLLFLFLGLLDWKTHEFIPNLSRLH